MDLLDHVIKLTFSIIFDRCNPPNHHTSISKVSRKISLFSAEETETRVVANKLIIFARNIDIPRSIDPRKDKEGKRERSENIHDCIASHESSFCSIEATVCVCVCICARARCMTQFLSSQFPAILQARGSFMKKNRGEERRREKGGRK